MTSPSTLRAFASTDGRPVPEVHREVEVQWRSKPGSVAAAVVVVVVVTQASLSVAGVGSAPAGIFVARRLYPPSPTSSGIAKTLLDGKPLHLSYFGRGPPGSGGPGDAKRWLSVRGVSRSSCVLGWQDRQVGWLRS
jgi:hypothetical protein